MSQRRDRTILFFQLTGIDRYAEAVAGGYAHEVRRQFPDDFTVDSDPKMKGALEAISSAIVERKSILNDRVMELYENSYTEKEIEDLIQFFSSPTGVKVVGLGGVVLPQAALIGDAWTTETIQSVGPQISQLLYGDVKAGATGETSTEHVNGVRGS